MWKIGSETSLCRLMPVTTKMHNFKFYTDRKEYIRVHQTFINYSPMGNLTHLESIGAVFAAIVMKSINSTSWKDRNYRVSPQTITVKPAGGKNEFSKAADICCQLIKR